MSWYQGFEPFVSENVPLAKMTTYRVGGPAEYFAQPPNARALGELLWRAAEENVPVRFLGHGTNLLVADRGVKGLVIKLPKSGFGFLRRSGDSIHVGAGHSLPGLVKWSVSQGLQGLECLQGVPGTVGAALRMNAGGKHGEICTSVRRVKGFERDGRPFDFSARECGFTYRNSHLHGRIVTECELELTSGDRRNSEEMMLRILNEKCASQPVDARSAGCVFKNPKLPGIAPAGRLIDELGMKGMSIGGAKVSTVHANFLVCEGAASADELVQLIRLIRQRVLESRGVQLELEVEVWGMDSEELLPRGRVSAALKTA
ncbi:MAG TPA: UDP-N-acetylmuramate dehydrogenase [Planctomycetota bacterium]|nr:UDP-N-acetylmuramate dehydrogenase [Planctomycetota bacterium]